MPREISLKKTTLISLTVLGLALFFGIVLIASGQSIVDNIEFPIAELGNCQNKEECKTYCDEPENLSQCIDFAERHSLMNEEEIRVAKRFADSGGVGPGGCRGNEECRAFCENVENIEECLLFAEEHKLVEGEELDEMRKISKALRGGAKLPGGCRSKNECETFCENPENIDECLLFAEAAGFIPPDELEEAKKFAELMRRGETPGGCRGERECRAYCENPENREACFEFAVKAGVVSEEEAELFRKTGGRGPGECSSEEECRAYCDSPQNTRECFEFGKEHGIVDEERFQHAQEGIGRLRGALDGAPEDVIACMDSKFGSNFIDGVMAGDVVPSPNVARDVDECFRKAFENKDFRPDDIRDFDEEPFFEEDFSSESGFVPDFPPEVKRCVENSLGNLERVFSGPPSPDTERIIQKCFESQFDSSLDRGFPPPDFDENFDHREDIDFSEERFRHDVDNFEESFKREFEEEGFFDNPDRFNREFDAEFEESLDHEFQRRREEETERRFKEEFERQTGEIDERFGDFPEGHIERDFANPADFAPENFNHSVPNPSDFTPENFDKQGASPVLLIRR